jgi:UDP-N-acetyl-D-galactosamine dehydrogenase
MATDCKPVAHLSDWLEQARVAVVGLGYVGLPLAIALGRKLPVVGFDIARQRVEALLGGVDEMGETTREELEAATFLSLSAAAEDIRDCNIYIVTVPTPVDEAKRPDLTMLLMACAMIGRMLKHGDIVVFESTVYPGCTEEDCVPVLENVSGLTLNEHFTVGYSPERINPGDHSHRLADVVKVTSGSTPWASERIDALYGAIVGAGICRASSIKVAEAAKIIENVQRDVNIAFVNEMTMILNRLGLDSEEVLEVAGTKWNFLPFRPGLVGGHCIGVDPYYLVHKAEEAGYLPEVTLAGRRLNESMGAYAASRLMERMNTRGIDVAGARVLVLGLSFKENCRDLRNTGVMGLVGALRALGLDVDVHDPLADPRRAWRDLGLTLRDVPAQDYYEAIIIAVGHDVFRELGAARIRNWGRRGHILFDLKQLFPAKDVDLRF